MNLIHFFVPHHKNNHRSKLLHNISLLFLILFFSSVSSATVFIHKTHPEVLGISYSVSENELLNLVNYQREQKGLPDLKENQELRVAAQRNAQYMFEHNYWAHFAPDGTSPWSFIKGAGYDYIYAGQNLAKGFTTSQDAVTAWMNSPTHRENILSPNFKDVGFAIEEGRLQGEDTVLIVQMFGSRANSAITNDDTLKPIGSVGEIDKNTANAQQVQGSSQARQEAESGVVSSEKLVVNPLINLVFSTKAVTFLILACLLIALLFDFIIIEKRKIPRIVGNNIDHIILISLFMLFLFIVRFGHIL
jgi:hypothetical protein